VLLQKADCTIHLAKRETVYFVISLNPRMLLSLTRLERRIVAVLALLIVLGLVGMSVL